MRKSLPILLLSGALALGPACAADLVAPQANTPIVAAGAQELDLTELQERIRESGAISFSQKQQIQNELDALLARFRTAQTGGKAALAALREPYDRLLTKMQSMLARDAQLANEVAASRGPIWDALSDRSKSAGL